VHGFLFLCDFAESINGKLYVQGGGWSRIGFTGEPLTIFVAGKVFVPWNRTNQKTALRLALLNADGQPVTVDDQGTAVEVTGEFEAGRPAGLMEGTDIDSALAFKFQGLPLLPGRYRWVMTVADDEIATVAFDVVTGPPNLF
jgi:hypothetical protein